MKMIMPIEATESGKIKHNLSPGSVISAGDLLASLELKDPSKVKKIGTFNGTLHIAESAVEMDQANSISNVLAGYNLDDEAVAQHADLRGNVRHCRFRRGDGPGQVGLQRPRRVQPRR